MSTVKEIVKEKDPQKNFSTSANVLFAAMIVFIVLLSAHLIIVIDGAVSASADYDNASAEFRADILDYYTCRIIDILTVTATAVIGFDIFRRFRRDKKPFVPYIAKDLRIMATVMLAGYLLICIVHICVKDAVAAPPNEYSGYINGTSMVLVSVLYMLGYIFDCGCELQQESDETL